MCEVLEVIRQPVALDGFWKTTFDIIIGSWLFTCFFMNFAFSKPYDQSKEAVILSWITFTMLMISLLLYIIFPLVLFIFVSCIYVICIIVIIIVIIQEFIS